MRLFRHLDSRLECSLCNNTSQSCLSQSGISSLSRCLEVVYELGGLGVFFYNTPDFLLIVHVRRCMMIQYLIFPPIIYFGWGAKGDQDPSLGMLEFHHRQRERERSRIEMQLEEVPPKGRDS